MPSVLEDILAGSADEVLDPKPLAENVWQLIWQATKEEPKNCLLTFLEIFVLKFLSDNLTLSVLPEAFRFNFINRDKKEFANAHGKTAIEYYVETIRPKIKQIFPDNTIVSGEAANDVFSLKTIVSKT